tara:strand:- start:293 stop:1744 length:1452 start_codon:yes stop_codon:yes gene_type:complete
MKSSEIKQKAIYKRLAIYSRDLPTGADFGDAPYPVITSQWNDPQVGNQIVTSTYSGTDTYHWVAIGANQSNGHLDSWDIDGVYKQVIRSNDLVDDYFSITDRKVSVKTASTQNKGVVKVGSTMSVDSDGVIDVSISPTNIIIVPNELARLALPISTGAQLAIQQDDGFTYGIEANVDTSIALNWKKIGAAASSVVSFNGRIGGVIPSTGDYTQDQIQVIQDDTSDTGYFGANNSGIYLEMGGKIYLAKQQDLSTTQGQVDSHEDDINNPTEGLKRKAFDQGSAITALQSTVYAPTIGLSDRVPALESKTSGLFYDDNTKRFNQSSAPVNTASSDADILTKADGDALYSNQTPPEQPIKADAGAYNSDTTDDAWAEICKVGNLSIEARYPESDIAPVRIVNSSGGTVVFLWSSIENSTCDSGMQAVSDGSSFLISNASAANDVKNSHSDVYTGAGVNTEAYSLDVSIRRLSSGIRIACSIIGKF